MKTTKKSTTPKAARQRIKASAKPGDVIILADGRRITVPETNAPESTPEAQKEDIQRAAGQAPIGDLTQAVVIADELTSRADASIWNLNSAEKFESIALRERSNVLNRFEYVPSRLQVQGKDTRYSILTCSDNGLAVGKPFADSYGLLNNGDFIAIVETIGAVLDKMGLAWTVNTTGTLMDRERMFISIRIAQGETFKIEDREFQAFLNCLNSIPSNSGCTVTFANNTFCVCCRNTFAHALTCTDGTKFHAAIKHTKGMKPALGDIPRIVEAYFSGNARLFAQLKAFSVFPASLGEAQSMFAAFLGRTAKGELTDKAELSTRTVNMVDTLGGLFAKGKGNKGETALDVFSAVTEYYTHMSAGETDNLTKQVQSSEVGSGADSKREFYSWLIGATQAKANWTGVCKVGETLLMAYRTSDKRKAK